MLTDLQPGTRVVRRHPATDDDDGQRHTIVARKAGADSITGTCYQITPAPFPFDLDDWWDASWFVLVEHEAA